MKNYDNNYPDEISLIEIWYRLKGRKRVIFLSATVLCLLGIAISLTSIKYWSVSAMLLPESDQNSGLSLGSLGGLASLAGVELPEGGKSSLTPELFPALATSTPFLLYLLEVEVFSGQQGYSMSLKEFLKNHSRTSLYTKMKYLPSSVIRIFRKESEYVMPDTPYVSFNESDYQMMELIKESMEVSVNKKNAVVTMTAEFQDPYVTADVVDATIAYYQRYITDYQTNKERRKLNFLSSQLNSKRVEYDSMQIVLAAFKDANTGQMNNIAQIDLQRLEDQNDLMFDIYSTIRKQVEEAEIAIEDRTPVFEIIEPVKIPIRKSKPQRAIMVISFTLLGAVLSSFWVLANDYFQRA